MKSDTLSMTMLFDFYGELLTDKQKELFDLYYNEDLSLTEIAEHSGISRQGARDGIMRAEAVLRDTEDKVGLVKKYSGFENRIIEIIEAASYINTINGTQTKNYEISRQTERILRLAQEIK